MGLTLLVVDGPAAGGVLKLPGDRLVLGRSAGTESLGGDEALSRQHAELVRADDGSLILRDLNSTNGTFVNDVRIASARVLRAGDLVHVGRSTLRVIGQGAAEDTAMRSPPHRLDPDGGVAIEGGQHAGPAGVVAGRDISGNVETSYYDQRRHYKRVDVDTTGFSLLLRTHGFGRFLVVLGTVLALAGFACFAYPLVRGFADAAANDSKRRNAQAECENLNDPFQQNECRFEAAQKFSGPSFEATPWIPLGGILFLAGIGLTWAGLFTVRHDREGPDRYY